MVGLEVPRPSKPSCVGRGTDSRLDVGLCLVGPRTLLEVGSLVGALCVVGGGELWGGRGGGGVVAGWVVAWWWVVVLVVVGHQ
jgi:hypothetical protein